MAQKPRWWRARIVCNEIRWVLRVPTTHHRFGLLRRRNCRLYWLQFSTRVSPNVPTTAALHIRDWQFNIVDSIHIRIDYGVAGFFCRRQYNASALLSGGSGSVLVVVSSIASAPAFRSGRHLCGDVLGDFANSDQSVDRLFDFDHRFRFGILHSLVEDQRCSAESFVLFEHTDVTVAHLLHDVRRTRLCGHLC